MKGYTFTIECPNDRCGGELTHENGSNTRRCARAVAACTKCHSRYLIHVELSIIDPPGRRAGDSYIATPVPAR